MSSKIEIERIKELTGKLTVLYVEDETVVHQQIVGILKLFFGRIISAYNGQEGLELLRNNQVDLVITDIQMPQLNGLDMVAHIRKEMPFLPVIITTAFNDQDYFIRSIDLRIDKYLLKPIQQKSAEAVFYSVAKMIDDRHKAEELEHKKLQERINKVSNQALSQIADSYQSPCIVYTGESVRYINKAFCEIFDTEALDSVEKGDVAFDQREGFLSDLKSYDEKEPTKNRVSIRRKNGRKIYRVMRHALDLDEDGRSSIIYLFNDITLEEYQKIKIQSYSEMLEEFIFKTRYRVPRKPVESANPTEEAAKEPVKVELKEEVSGAPKLVIDDSEYELLRRSHKHKTTAVDYIEELDDDTLKELTDLDELDKDFEESIVLLNEEANIEGIRQMEQQLTQYAAKISLLFEFEDLSYAIRSLALLLASIDEQQLDEKRLKKIVLFLSGIQSDLAGWRETIFIQKDAVDIHYLDSSLFSACLQIELALTDEISEMDSDEDDLILF